MGSFKKEAARKERLGRGSEGLSNVKVKGENFYRSAKKIKTLNMFKDGKAQRNAQGIITKAAAYQSRETPSARIEPNRKWFGNTRVIAQKSLEQFRNAIAENASDPYSYLLKQNKLPMGLIQENKTKNGVKQHQAKITVETAPFSDTFGPKARRKRVKLSVTTAEDLAGASEKMYGEYLERREQANLLSGRSADFEQEHGNPPNDDGRIATAKEPIFSKGQSKRIWNELYKVIDSSDVVIHVLDARDPEGTRCRSVEKYIKEEAPHKHLLFVLNKCDLVPTSTAAAWVKHLSKEYPTLAFHASITNSFGKGSLISLLRQFSTLHSHRKQISVGFIGYPNTGKSSIINTLRKKKVCTVAPIPGETKVWQYITLMKRIYLIDCPGVVPPNNNDSQEDILLRGVVRVENVENPEQYVAAAIQRCQQRHVERTYGLDGYTDATDFLEKLAKKGGRLLKGGEADMDGVAKMVLNDFIRGKIPWFSPAPGMLGDGRSSSEPGTRKEGFSDVTRLNQAHTHELRGRKRKREEESEELKEGPETASKSEAVDVADNDASDLSEYDGALSDDFDDSDDGEEHVSSNDSDQSRED